jgi:hypothetical protein
MNYINLPFKASLLATTIALTACGGSSSSNPEGLSSKKEGTAVISAKGGSSAYNAGDGGYIEIEKKFSSTPLNITVRGLPDTKYKPLKVEANLGANPVEITANTTINNDTGSLSTGDLYLYNQKMYKYDGDSIGADSSRITGLSIAEGKTLTLDNGNSTLYLYLPNDLQNNGVITVEEYAVAGATGSVRLYLNNYIGTGDINLAGKVIGQNGGDLRIYANIVKNDGSINTSGHDGDDTVQGGSAGHIRLQSQTLIENTGSMLAKGGSSTGARTNSGDYVNFSSQRDSVNTGIIDTSSGSGVNEGSTYSAGSVNLYANNLLLNTGDITADGSDSILNDAKTAGGRGGQGGYINFGITGGEGGEGGQSATYEMPRLVNTGNVQANGGDSVYDGYNAGEGGFIGFDVEESYYGDQIQTAPAVLAVSGNLKAEGGRAITNTDSDDNTGGDGGQIYISHASQASSELDTYIVGYASIDASGGNGLLAGDGGGIEIYSQSNSNEDDAVSFAPASPIDITTNLVANAGTVVYSETLTATPNAGDGGSVYVGIYTEHSSLQKKLTLNLEGDVSVNASNVKNGSGDDAGYIAISGPQDIMVRSDFSLNGSNETGTDNYNEGGEGGYLSISSENDSVNYKGNISATGGAGQNEGGDGGYFMVQSATASKISGSISLAGGNASATEVEGNDTYGGNGGFLRVISNDFNTNLSASYTINPGTGTDAGITGGAFVDFTCIEGQCQGNN